MIESDNYPEPKTNQGKVLRSTKWQCLCVLDSCRWDALNSITNGYAQPVSTPSIRTKGWLEILWGDKDYWQDITYVSAHPRTEEYPDPGMENYVEHHVRGYKMCEDDLLGTIRPDEIASDASSCEPPVVVHFAQPAPPFIGNISLRAGKYKHVYEDGEKLDSVPQFTENDPQEAIYRMVKEGYVDLQVLHDAYMDNLKMVFDYCEGLTHFFDSVHITSTHGELLGPTNFGHRHAVPEVEVVPWLHLK